MRYIVLLLLVLLQGFVLHAQQHASAYDFEVSSPHEDFMSGMRGLKVELGVGFDTYSENYFARGFELDFVLVTKAGELVFDSKGKFTESIRMDKPVNAASKLGMEDADVELFVPFKEIKLQSGTHTVFLMLSMKNDHGNYPEFHKREITFVHEFHEAHTFAEQEFKISQPKMAYGVQGFGVAEPGMSISLNAGLKYGANQVDAEDYDIHLRILSPDGSKVLYNSVDDPSIHHRSKSISTDNFPGEAKELKFFVNYVTLKMDGPGNALVVIEAEEEGVGKRELYRELHNLATPVKYRFADQVFTPGKVETSRTMVDGVTGIRVKFHCDFKFTAPLIDADRGDFVFSAVFQTANGDTVFSPTFLRRVDYATTAAWDKANPLLEPQGANIELFIPMHRLRAAQGPQALKYTIYVSDFARRARFPVIGSGTIQVDQPRVLAYKIQMRHLQVIPGNYDAQVAIFGNILPDLEWRIEVGNDTEYQSPTMENSLIASTGILNVKLSEGDKLNLGLWDIDSGFFNRNDGLGNWTIPYSGKGDQFLHRIESQGVIHLLEMEITRQ